MTPIVSAAVSLFGAPLSAAFSSSSVPSSGAIASSSTAASLSAPAFGAAGLGATAAPPAPFADLLTEAVGQVEHLEQQSKSAIEGLISGKGVDVHEAMISAQKAGMGFELMLSVRNKALAAYQQVMGMQF